MGHDFINIHKQCFQKEQQNKEVLAKKKIEQRSKKTRKKNDLFVMILSYIYETKSD